MKTLGGGSVVLGAALSLFALGDIPENDDRTDRNAVSLQGRTGVRDWKAGSVFSPKYVVFDTVNFAVLQGCINRT